MKEDFRTKLAHPSSRPSPEANKSRDHLSALRYNLFDNASASMFTSPYNNSLPSLSTLGLTINVNASLELRIMFKPIDTPCHLTSVTQPFQHPRRLASAVS